MLHPDLENTIFPTVAARREAVNRSKNRVWPENYSFGLAIWHEYEITLIEDTEKGPVKDAENDESTIAEEEAPTIDQTRKKEDKNNRKRVKRG